MWGCGQGCGDNTQHTCPVSSRGIVSEMMRLGSLERLWPPKDKYAINQDEKCHPGLSKSRTADSIFLKECLFSVQIFEVTVV